MGRFLREGAAIGANGAGRTRAVSRARFLAWSPVLEAALALGFLFAACFLAATYSVPIP